MANWTQNQTSAIAISVPWHKFVAILIAELLVLHVLSLHRLPQEVISNRVPSSPANSLIRDQWLDCGTRSLGRGCVACIVEKTLATWSSCLPCIKYTYNSLCPDPCVQSLDNFKKGMCHFIVPHLLDEEPGRLPLTTRFVCILFFLSLMTCPHPPHYRCVFPMLESFHLFLVSSLVLHLSLPVSLLFARSSCTLHLCWCPLLFSIIPVCPLPVFRVPVSSPVSFSSAPVLLPALPVFIQPCSSPSSSCSLAHWLIS